MSTLDLGGPLASGASTVVPEGGIDIEHLLQEGIEAVWAGDNARALDLLNGLVQADGSNVQAWLELSRLVESQAGREYCLRRVLALEPDNRVAAHRLSRLEIRARRQTGPRARQKLAVAAGEEAARGAVAGSATEEAGPLTLPAQEEPGERGPSPLTGQAVGETQQDCSAPALAVDVSAPEWPLAHWFQEGAAAARTAAEEAGPLTVPAWEELDGRGPSPLARQAGGEEQPGCAAPALAVDVSAPEQPLDAWFQEGAAAARTARRSRARESFRRIIEAHDGHTQATLRPSGVAAGEEQRARVARAPALSGSASAQPAAAPASPAEVTDGLAAPPAPVPAGERESWAAGEKVRRAPSAIPWTAVTALLVLGAITLAELTTSLVDPRLGMVLNCLILVALFVLITLTKNDSLRALLVGLTLAPLIRMLSVSLPLIQFPMLYWYLITSVPLFVGTWVAARSLGYSWRALGLTLRGWPLQLVVALSGLVFGVAEYFILRPEPLAEELSWAAIWLPALILFVCTGLLEEMIFRGLLQRSAGDALGRWGMPYVALLFGVLHLGYQSLLDVAFVTAVGLFFGVVVQRTRSLLGVTLAHGLTNTLLFLVMPFVMG